MIREPLGAGAGMAGPLDIELPEEVVDPTVALLPDGGAEVTLGPEPMVPMGDHAENLAEILPEDVVKKITRDVLDGVEADNTSREGWLNAYKRGIQLLGLSPEDPTEDFVGIATATHPGLLTAVVRFWALGRDQFLPPSGPAKAQVVGESTPEIEAQAERVKTYLNYFCTEVAEEFYPDDSQMLIYLALGGSAFKKVYDDRTFNRPTSRFVTPDDVIVSFQATDLKTAPRITHVLKPTKGEMRLAQLSGFWRDIELSEPDEEADQSDDAVKSAVDRSEGRSAELAQGDDRYEVYETQVNLDIEGLEHTVPVLDEMGNPAVDEAGNPLDDEPSGIPLPYVVTIDKGSEKCLAIRRNWKKDGDPLIKREHFVGYRFVPGLGFYGLGYLQLIGGLAEAATGLLRTMLDAALFETFPAGFKARGLRMNENSPRLSPGQFQDVDVPAGQLKDSIIPMPFKGVSAGAFQVYQDTVQQMDKLGGTSILPSEGMDAKAPVGTTLAMAEEASRTTTAIMRDLWVSRRKEFRLLSAIFAETLPDQYPYVIQSKRMYIAREDFNDRVDVVPVADPDATNKVKQIFLAQTKLQLAVQGNQSGVQHDMREVFKDVYLAFGVQDMDRLMPPPPQAISADPATENVALMNGAPVKVRPDQNHDAHVQAHMAFATTLAQSPATQAVMMTLGPAIQAHVAEHVAVKYMLQASMAAGMQLGQPLPPQIENMVAMKIAQVAPQIAQAMTPPAPPDPAMAMVQVEQAKVAQKAEESKVDAALETRKLDLKEAEINLDAVEAGAKLGSQEKIEGMKLQGQVMRDATRPKPVVN